MGAWSGHGATGSTSTEGGAASEDSSGTWATSVRVCVGPLTIDRQRFSAELAGVQLGLTPLEFDLLDALARCMGSVVAYQDVVERVMGARFVPESSALRVHITNLRRKLGSAGPCIVTVRGRGLLF